MNENAAPVQPGKAKRKPDAASKPRAHLSECYVSQYPDDPGVYCTCHDWSPDQ